MAYPALIQKILDLRREIRALRKEESWTTSSPVPSNGILNLPAGIKYIPGRHLINLNWDGLVCFPGKQFEEVSIAGQKESSSIKLLFDAPAGSEFHVCVMPHSMEDVVPETDEFKNLQLQVARISGYIDELSGNVAYVDGKE